MHITLLVVVADVELVDLAGQVHEEALLALQALTFF